MDYTVSWTKDVQGSMLATGIQGGQNVGLSIEG